MSAMRGLVAMLGCFAAGCLGANAHPCESSDHSQSWLCPANLACAQAPAYCGSPGLIEQCNGKPDFETCAYSDTEAGACHGGVCTGCSADLEGCPVSGWTPMTSNTGVNLYSLWVAGRGDAYAGGDAGTMLHYDGIAWTPQVFPTTAQGAAIVGLWGTSTNDVYAVAGTKIFHWDGMTWREETTSPQPLLAIAGAGGLVTAAGTNATIVQFDGATWTTTTNVLGLPATLDAIWAADADDIFAAGSGGVVLRFHGGMWTTSKPPGGLKLDAIWGSAANDVIAVGDHGGTGATIFHFDGGWTTESLNVVSNLLGVWGSGGAVFACGQSGGIALRTAGVWASMTTPAAVDIQAISGSSQSDVFAVGRGGTIWRYTGN